jgi:prepilin-type N-terminal cleavage/methylation domain-containing protein
MAFRHQRGFTLLEMMIVVGMIAVIAALAVYQIQKQRERVSIERGIAQMRSALEESRALATVAGSRAGTPRLVQDGSCNWVGANQMEVQIDGPSGVINYPSSVAVDPGDPERMIVSCDNWRVADVIYGTGAGSPGTVPTFSSPAGVVNFAFSPSGRLVAAPGPIFVQLQGVDSNPPGVRVLASGIMCQASDPSGAIPCDESTNW